MPGEYNDGGSGNSGRGEYNSQAPETSNLAERTTFNESSNSGQEISSSDEFSEGRRSYRAKEEDEMDMDTLQDAMESMEGAGGGAAGGASGGAAGGAGGAAGGAAGAAGGAIGGVAGAVAATVAVVAVVAVMPGTAPITASFLSLTATETEICYALELDLADPDDTTFELTPDVYDEVYINVVGRSTNLSVSVGENGTVGKISDLKEGVYYTVSVVYDDVTLAEQSITTEVGPGPSIEVEWQCRCGKDGYFYFWFIFDYDDQYVAFSDFSARLIDDYGNVSEWEDDGSLYDEDGKVIVTMGADQVDENGDYIFDDDENTVSALDENGDFIEGVDYKCYYKSAEQRIRVKDVLGGTYATFEVSYCLYGDTDNPEVMIIDYELDEEGNPVLDKNGDPIRRVYI